jgi:hypothetical protein
MSDWYSRFIDADTDNDPEEDNMDGKKRKRVGPSVQRPPN